MVELPTTFSLVMDSSKNAFILKVQGSDMAREVLYRQSSLLSMELISAKFSK